MTFYFGIHTIPEYQIFWEGQHFYAMVNLKPITPGHLLLCSKRRIQRFSELLDEELAELHSASAMIVKELMPDGATLVIQDGSDAGQTIPHIHMHIVPQKRVQHVDNYARPDRTREDMETEASKYAAILCKKEGICIKTD